jgi:hypothetical protein
VYSYVENFIGFPVGTAVPTGYYDRQKGVWVGSDNGRVIEVLSETGGTANLDVTGDGLADTGTALTELGVTDDERLALASIYSPGQSLWRVPITHFTTWDHNWPYGPPSDAVGPNQPGLSQAQGTNGNNDPCQSSGSIIECQNQVLRERIPVTGTPFNLYYSSSRMPGRKDVKQVTIPVSGPEALPGSLKRIDITYSIAGQSFTQSYASAPDLSHTFLWDGLNRFGQQVVGSSVLSGKVSYVYDLVYVAPEEWDQAWGGFGSTEFSGARSSNEIGLAQPFSTRLQGSHPDFGLGGWDLDVHMFFDPITRVLYRGNGTQRAAESLPDIITTVAGTPTVDIFAGDGGPAALATMRNPLDVVMDAKGNLYLIDDRRIRVIGTDGIITTIAGTGVSGCTGDGGPAIDATFSSPTKLAIGNDDSLFVSDRAQNRCGWADRAGGRWRPRARQR